MFGRLIIVLCLILSFIGCSHFDSQVFEKNSENVYAPSEPHGEEEEGFF